MVIKLSPQLHAPTFHTSDIVCTISPSHGHHIGSSSHMILPTSFAASFAVSLRRSSSDSPSRLSSESLPGHLVQRLRLVLVFTTVSTTCYHVRRHRLPAFCASSAMEPRCSIKTQDYDCLSSSSASMHLFLRSS